LTVAIADIALMTGSFEATKDSVVRNSTDNGPLEVTANVMLTTGPVDIAEEVIFVTALLDATTAVAVVALSSETIRAKTYIKTDKDVRVCNAMAVATRLTTPLITEGS
jgi:hypothetical protein